MIRLRVASCIAPVLAATVLAACAPAVKRPPAAVAEPATALVSFEKRQRDKAEALARDERWSDAADHWHVLALVRPDVPDYARRRDEARSRSRQAAGTRLDAAAVARRRGNAEQASLLYLKALSADPGNSAALQALREIEKERASRGNTVKPGRAIATMPRQQRGASPAAAPPYPAERRDLDYGVMLYHQAEYASSIRTLETYLKTAPRDELGRRYLAQASVQLGQQLLAQGKKEEALAMFDKAGAADPQEAEGVRGSAASLRKLLADEHYEQGLRAYNSDLRAAIEHWERSLKYDPNHLNASLRLRQARQVEKNLRNISAGQPKK